jgi:transcriptional regulator with XRE-family HTH domain
MSQLIVARCYESTGPVITALLQKHSAFKEAAQLEQPHTPILREAANFIDGAVIVAGEEDDSRLSLMGAKSALRWRASLHPRRVPYSELPVPNGPFLVIFCRSKTRTSPFLKGSSYSSPPLHPPTSAEWREFSRSMTMESLSSRLREERKRLCLTQAAFAKIGGVAANAQVHYESGSRCPKADYLQRISAVGVDINYVISGNFTPKGLDKPPLASEKNVDALLDQLGGILWMTATTVAEVAIKANPSEAVSRRMNQNLRDFQSESQRFIALACDLGGS